MKFRIGNLHETLEGDYNTHKWTTFVKLENEEIGNQISKLVKKVKFELHPTFSSPLIEVNHNDLGDGKQFAIGPLRGWGVFNITITIYWANSTGL